MKGILHVLHKFLAKIKSEKLNILILARKKDVPKSKLPKEGKLDDDIKERITLSTLLSSAGRLSESRMKSCVIQQLNNWIARKTTRSFFLSKRVWKGITK